MNNDSSHVLKAEERDDTRPILISPYVWIGDFVRGHIVVRFGETNRNTVSLQKPWPRTIRLDEGFAFSVSSPFLAALISDMANSWKTPATTWRY